jgi:3-deoxy-manno-octulosonate cytidylyltransferase (CMP-KDO synthetase)
MTKFKVVIPARYGSTRLPAKPLADICGKPMVVRVAEQAAQSGADEIIIATDDTSIANVVSQYGFKAAMTSDRHETGTDRIAEVVKIMGWADDEIIVNVQGDEPLIAPSVITNTARNLEEHTEASIATCCHTMSGFANLDNPNAVKVVIDKNGYAIYFSRAPIPYPRNGMLAHQHVGIYAYRAKFLNDYHLLEKSKIETIESLEQLRTLWNGHKISIFVSPEKASIGVDTPDDLELVRKIFCKKV